MKMRHILFLACLLFGLLAPAAAAQQQQSEFWSRKGDRLHFAHAGISVPAAAGPLHFKKTGEFQRKGEGLDTSVTYESADGAIWATIYVYMPGVAHTGFAALATAEGIKANSKTPVTVHPMRVVAAGGAPDTAIRAEFDGYRGDLRSSAAFVRAGRWLVKLRVSGPQAKAAEVDATMTALLRGLAFDAEIRPAPATLIDPAPCPEAALPDATPVAMSAAEILAQALMLAASAPGGDGGEARESGEPNPLLSRFGASWCRGVADTGKAEVTFLRALDAAAAGPRADSVLVVLYSDAGGMLELTRASESDAPYVLVNHGLAVTTVLGALDTTLSDAQIGRYLSGANDDVLRTRATIQLSPDGDTQMTVPAPEPAVPTT